MMKDIPQTTWLNPKIEIVHSRIHGKGMRAFADIRQEETVLIWGGECYTDKAGANAVRRQGKAVMQWDEDVFSYEIAGDDDLYAVNHSCDPNSWMADAFTLIARRTIASGEEITTDYALWEMDDQFISSWTCQCGAPCCRGRVTGNDWKIRVLQQRYAGHFSPLINTLIQTMLCTSPDTLE